MNILYYDESTPINYLIDLWDNLRPQFPEGELLFLPISTKLLIDVSAEELFNVGDKIGVALEKIKEERPEEYEKAYNNRMVILRDEQWEEVIKQLNENRKK